MPNFTYKNELLRKVTIDMFSINDERKMVNLSLNKCCITNDDNLRKSTTVATVSSENRWDYAFRSNNQLDSPTKDG